MPIGAIHSSTEVLRSRRCSGGRRRIQRERRVHPVGGRCGRPGVLPGFRARSRLRRFVHGARRLADRQRAFLMSTSRTYTAPTRTPPLASAQPPKPGTARRRSVHKILSRAATTTVVASLATACATTTTQIGSVAPDAVAREQEHQRPGDEHCRKIDPCCRKRDDQCLGSGPWIRSSGLIPLQPAPHELRLTL